MRERTLTVGGLPIRYWERGSGRAVTLLHGGFGDAQMHWQSVLLGDEYRLLAPDLPGFGRSAPLAKPDFALWLGWLEAFLKELQVEQTVLVGNSFGGLLARYFTALHPTMVPALVLVNGGDLPNDIPLARFLGGLPVLGDVMYDALGRSAVTPKNLTGLVHHPAALSPDALERIQTNARGTAGIMRTATLSRFAASDKIKVPVLLVWGVEDKLTPVPVAKRLQKELGSSELVEIADAGHLPHLEAADVFNVQLTQFLERINRPPRPAGRGAGILTER